MNVGQIITRALKRTNLSVSDYATRLMATEMLDEIVQSLWSSYKFPFRISRFNFNTADGVEEYALHKFTDVIVPFTFRGTDPARIINYEPSSDFFKKRRSDLESGDPHIYRTGEFYGVERQPSASSQVSVVSSESNTTAGTISVTYGSRRMVLSAATLTLSDLGKWIRVGTDYKRFRIVSLEPNGSGSSSIFNVAEPYDGTSNTTATFVIGDVQQKVNIQGFDDQGAVIDEELQLNGATSVSSTKTFASLIRITKSDKTHGRITATSNSGGVTNIILDPGETELDFKTVKLYRIPQKIERIEFETYTKHPVLYRDTDSPLFPSQWHPILVLDLFIAIKEEFLGQEVPVNVLNKREGLWDSLITRSNDADEWHVTNEDEGLTSGLGSQNLPSDFDIDDGF